MISDLGPSPIRATVLALVMTLPGVLLPDSVAVAQAFVPAKGTGSWTLAYQNTSVHGHTTYLGERINAGKIHTQALSVGLDYGLTDKLAVTVSVPYTRSKYEGAFRHQPAFFPAHRDEPFIDDGRFHGGWQDYSLGIRYQLATEPLLVAPFVNVRYPSHDYVYFGQAAIGTRQWRVAVGADAAKQFAPPLDRLYVGARYAYSIGEKVLGIALRSSEINLELGCFVTPRLTARALLVWNSGHNGLDFPVDFVQASPELSFQHDRVQRRESLQGGLGLGFQVNEEYSVFGNWLTFLDGENAGVIHNAFTVGINRGF